MRTALLTISLLVSISAAADELSCIQQYLAAVKRDPTTQDLEKIQLCQPVEFTTENAPSAPLSQPGEINQALRMYVDSHPDDLNGVSALALSEYDMKRSEAAEALLVSFVAAHRTDPEARRALVTLYSKESKDAESLSAARQAALDFPSDTSVLRFAGVVAYEVASKKFITASDLRTTALETGESSLRQALKLEPASYESMVYLATLLREKVRTEADRHRAAALTKEADEWLARARDEVKRRQAAAKKKPVQ